MPTGPIGLWVVSDRSWSNQLWAKIHGNGKTAALFINGGPSNYSTNVSLQDLNMTDLGGPRNGATAVTVIGVWSGADAGPVVGDPELWGTGEVASMDSRFVIFEAKLVL